MTHIIQYDSSSFLRHIMVGRIMSFRSYKDRGRRNRAIKVENQNLLKQQREFYNVLSKQSWDYADTIISIKRT